MIVLVVILLWLVVGFALGLYEARRGHWRWLWLLGAVGGPFAIPLARQIQENEDLAHPIEVSTGTGRGPGAVDVLAGIDGSPASVNAAKYAVKVLGGRLGGLTLALVTDFDIHEAAPGPVDADHPSVAAERRSLEQAAGALEEVTGFSPATVVLSGPPAPTLADHARSTGSGVVVIGSKGRGVSKRLLGSCAEQLASGSPVPVLILPASGSDQAPESESHGIGNRGSETAERGGLER